MGNPAPAPGRLTDQGGDVNVFMASSARCRTPLESRGPPPQRRGIGTAGAGNSDRGWRQPVGPRGSRGRSRLGQPDPAGPERAPGDGPEPAAGDEPESRGHWIAELRIVMERGAGGAAGGAGAGL